MYTSDEKRGELIACIRTWYPDWQDFHDPAFQKEEIEYKRTAAQNAQELLAEPVLRALLDNQEYSEIRRRLIKVAQLTNLLYMSTPATGDLRILNQAQWDTAQFAQQMYDLLYGPGTGEERLQRYLDFCASAALDTYWTFPTYYLYLCHPQDELFVKPKSARAFCEQVDTSFVWSAKPTAQAYGAIKEIARALITAFAAYGAADMMDAQAIIWTCRTQAKPPKEPSGQPDGKMTPEEAEDAENGAEQQSSAYPRQPAYSLAQFAEESGTPAKELERWVRAIKRKGQAVLYGPPGTGKTYHAERLARHLVGGGDGLWELVQFHPAYAYEDFV